MATSGSKTTGKTSADQGASKRRSAAGRPSRRVSIRSGGNPAEAAPGTAQPTEATQEQPETATEAATSEPTATADAPSKARKPRKTSTASSTAKAATESEEAPAEPKESAEEPSDTPAPAKRRTRQPRVLVPERVSAGERVSLSLHPDDAKMLRVGRAKDGADANARIRALLACYRADADLKAQVDQLARTASRLGSTRR